MKYLVSVAPKAAELQDQWAPGGEPVVPWYPHSPQNAFLAIPSFQPSQYAQVVDDPAVDVDEVARKLKSHYPGLPAKLHDNYVLAIARAAHRYPAGTIFRIYVDYDKAEMCVAGKEDVRHVLWEKLPL